MEDQIPITPEGLATLREEVNQLKNVDRLAISKEIEVAREHGDLKENAEYHAAKEKQGLVEARIRDLEAKISHAEVIDVTTMEGDRVIFGSTVTILYYESDEEKTYRIVGEDEADLGSGKISYGSPIAKSLMGKEEGDEVTIHTPGGKHEVEIISVQYI